MSDNDLLKISIDSFNPFISCFEKDHLSLKENKISVLLLFRCTIQNLTIAGKVVKVEI